MDDFQSLPEYQALVVAATPKPERSMGESVIPAEPPQWKDVRSLGKTLFDQWSNELELRIYLIQAEANLKGFVGFEQSLRDTYELLDTQWDNVRPLADEDDPDDMYYERVNYIQELSQKPEFLDALYRSPLASARGIGEFSSRDIDICAGNIDASDEDRARCQDGLIRGAFAETEPEQLQAIHQSLQALIQLCADLEALFVAKTNNTNPVSLSELNQRLQLCSARFLDYAEEHLTPAEPPADAEEETPTGSDSPSQEPGQVTSAPTGTISNRREVADAFEAILRYYQVHEPSSPVRLFAVRAREFVDKSFFDLLRDLVPEHQDNLGALLAQLEKQPLAYLLSDSYARYSTGDLSLPEIHVEPADESPQSEVDPVAPDVAPVTDDSAHSDDQQHQETAADAMPVVDQPAIVETQASSNGVDGTSVPTVLVSREQVIQVLNDIEAFYLSAEPASPIPLVLADMRKLVPKRFGELITEFRRFMPDQESAE